jgi:hypothetical protein
LTGSALGPGEILEMQATSLCASGLSLIRRSSTKGLRLAALARCAAAGHPFSA